VTGEVMNTTDVDLVEQYQRHPPDRGRAERPEFSRSTQRRSATAGNPSFFLKRGMMTTIEELLMSAEYILSRRE